MIKNSVITADIHCFAYKPFSTITDTGRNSRFVECLKVLDEIYTFAEKKKCENVYIAGDLFHNRSKIDTVVYDDVYSFFKTVDHFHTYLLVGNHDQAVKDGSIHSLRPFAELHNIDVIDHPLTIENVLFVPYQDHFNVDLLTPADFFIGHAGVTGATVGASNFTIGEVLSPKHLRQYKKAFLGHFHKNQQIDNIYIPGSPLQHTFGERDDDKGFYYVDDKYNVDFVRTSAPRFGSVDVTSEDDLVGFDEKDYMQFIVKSKKVKKVDFTKYAKNCKVILDLPKKYEERLEIKSAESDVDIFNHYLQQFKTPLIEQGLDIETLSTLGAQVWERYEKGRVG